MATDLDRAQARDEAGRFGGISPRALRSVAVVRRNLVSSRDFAARRRRDLRFRVLPYDGFEIVNLAAVALTALVLLVVLLDPYLTVWQATLPESLIRVFKVLTDLGKSSWMLIGAGAIVIVSLLTDASRLGPRLRMRKAVRTLAAFYVFAAVAVPGIIANFSKYLLGRARPKHFAENGSFSFDFWSGDAGWASFPSGHATTAMALGVALALLFPRLRWLFLCLGFWVAVSRLFVRAHYPSDVLAGCLLGGVAAWLIARAFARRRLVFGFDAAGSLVRRRGASGRLR